MVRGQEHFWDVIFRVSQKAPLTHLQDISDLGIMDFLLTLPLPTQNI